MAALDSLIAIGAPGSKTWVIREGDNPALKFTIKVNGSPLDLTGVSGSCSIRASYATASSTLATPTVSFPARTAGQVMVALTTSQSSALRAAVVSTTDDATQQVPVGVFDIELQDGTNEVTIVGGPTVLSREATP